MRWIEGPDGVWRPEHGRCQERAPLPGWVRVLVPLLVPLLVILLTLIKWLGR